MLFTDAIALGKSDLAIVNFGNHAWEFGTFADS
jgi:uncharacterized protein YegL